MGKSNIEGLIWMICVKEMVLGPKCYFDVAYLYSFTHASIVFVSINYS